jgi:hypothetical protein
VWKLLRRDMQFDRSQSERIVLEMIEAYARQPN